jgi:hypothetical protein
MATVRNIITLTIRFDGDYETVELGTGTIPTSTARNVLGLYINK